MAEVRTWLEIRPATVVANARTLAKRVAPASLCAVVKSNAYGHGLVPIAQALAASGIAGLRLAVFSLDEALALRSAGIDLPILVVGPVSAADLDEAVYRRIELGLLDERDCEAFARHGITAHVKFDTGTSRFGIARERAAAVLARCRDLGVCVAGLYSHLANAEDLDKTFTMKQVAALADIASINSRIHSTAPDSRANAKPLLHIAASAAAIMWRETRLDMVRCGIALYGAWPSTLVEAAVAGDDPAFSLEPALQWFAPIVEIRDVRAGDSVGYGCAYVAHANRRIAVLPLGYADGVPRAAGDGRMQVRVFADDESRKPAAAVGAKAPIVGRVCMNACMLDVTDVAPAPQPGDRVGFDVEALARAAGTINYEILARLPAHLERRYH